MYKGPQHLLRLSAAQLSTSSAPNIHCSTLTLLITHHFKKHKGGKRKQKQLKYVNIDIREEETGDGASVGKNILYSQF